MALFKNFFKPKSERDSVGKSTSVVAGADEFITNEPVSLEHLQKLIPIRQLDNEFLAAFALEGKAKVFAAGTTLFVAGTTTDVIYFLLRGDVDLVDELGRKYVINLEDPKSRFALSAGKVHTTTAVAKTEVSILEVSQNVMQMNQAKKRVQLDLPARYENNRLLQLFVQHFANDEIEIPSLPDTALKLRRAMQVDIGILEVVAIIQLDPVVAGKLIHC